MLNNSPITKSTQKSVIKSVDLHDFFQCFSFQYFLKQAKPSPFGIMAVFLIVNIFQSFCTGIIKSQVLWLSKFRKRVHLKPE